MKKQIGKILRRMHASKRTRSNRLKNLRLESLEARQLLAADFAASAVPFHNQFIPTDVSGDGNISALDPLLVVNMINNSGDLPDSNENSGSKQYYDVNGDNQLSPIDALLAINAVNAEAEGPATAVFSYQFIDTNGAPIDGNTVTVGEVFQLEVKVKDNRGFSSRGINAAYLDLDFDNSDLFDVAVGEIQTLKFFIDKLDIGATDSSFTLTLGGETTTPIRIFTEGGSPRNDVAIANAINDALSALPSVGTGNVSAIVDAVAKSQDAENNIQRFNFEIRFKNQLAGQDLPLLVMDASNVTTTDGNPLEFAVAEVLAGDQSTPTAEAQAVTYADLYDFARRADVASVISVDATDGTGVSDGTTVVVRSFSGNVRTFEFDKDDPEAVTAGNIRVAITDASTQQEIAQALVDAINTADFGVSSTLDVDANGESKGVTLTDAASPNPTTITGTGLSFNETSGKFNDIGATSQQIPLPGPADPKTVFVIPMVAIAPGTVTFTPNQADNPPSTDLLTSAGTEVITIPTMMAEFGAAQSITIIADRTAPRAEDDTISVAEDTSVTLNGNVTNNDTVTAPRTLSVQSAATIAGTTVGSLNGLTYTPPANFFGTDVITYTAIDSTGLVSNTATVTINVTPVNDPPTAVNDPDANNAASFTVVENEANNVLPVLDNDSAGPGETTDTITITSLSVTTTANGGTVSISGGGSTVTYTPATDFIGTDTFMYTITDGGGLTDTATVTVEVEPGIVPRARDDGPAGATGAEGTSITVDVLANDRFNDGAEPTLLSVTNGNHGTVAINDGGTPADMTDDTAVYTPNDVNFFGTDTFTYTMNDTLGTGADSVGTVTITVTDVNDTPELMDDTASATEDTPATIAISTLLSNDSPGAGENEGVAQTPQTLTITGVAPVGDGGTVAIVGNDVVYTPATDFNGQFLFTYTAEDNGNPALSATATVTVTVAAVNDDPIAVDDTASTNEDTAVTIALGDLLSNDSPGPATATDESSQTLTVDGVQTTSAAGGSVSLNGSVVYTPPADFNGTDTFTYSMNDGAGGSASATVTVTVNQVNDPPVAVDDTQRVFKDIANIIQVSDLLANDSRGPANESGQTLTVVAVTATANTNGTVVLNNDGTITYTPTADFTGAASFEYTIRDDGSPNLEATGTVNLNVEAFVPSTIAGTIYVDETSDGILDAAERRLGGIHVTLTGTSLGQSIVPQTIMTLSDGTYEFSNLGPGQYMVNYATPQFFNDGPDTPGLLGDADAVENQFTINIVEPGGAMAVDYNFAVAGLEAGYGRILDQLASRHTSRNASLAYNGLVFGVDSSNGLLWSSKLDGFDDALFAEADLISGGMELLLTIVDQNHDVFTARLGRGEFVRTFDDAGNAVVRVLGDASRFSWQLVNRATPPFNATGYLDAVDEAFAQEGW